MNNDRSGTDDIPDKTTKEESGSSMVVQVKNEETPPLCPAESSRARKVRQAHRDALKQIQDEEGS